MLQERFSQVVAFADDDIDQSCHRWKAALLGKFLDKGLPIDFVQHELRLRWRVEDNFQVSSLLDGVLLFDLSSEEVQARILAKGPWTLVGQLLAP